MRDYINIPTPCEEPYVQVGEPGYREKVIAECRRLIELLRRKSGPEPEGTWLSTKWFEHDFGSYCEAVCYYNTDILASADCASWCESETPAIWEDELWKKRNARSVARS